MTSLSRSPKPPRPQARAGRVLREWRAMRALSQLDLALDAGVSTRHLSYIETGKAQPSHELVLRFAEVLGMPSRERNVLLVAAGYAPEIAQAAASESEQAGMRRAIDHILAQHEPYPAFLINRHWDVLIANSGAQRVGDFVMDGRPSAHGNIIRQVFDPDDMRAGTANWHELAGELIQHLHAAIAATPTDNVLKGLLDEALAYPDVPPQWRHRDVDAALSPLLTTVFRKHGRELRFLSTFTTFAFARNITLQDQHIECCFPMDDATSAFCRELRDRQVAAQSGMRAEAMLFGA
ncbi:MAG: helix-turn-helix domain-containing protein [Lysobacter sp.]